MPARFGNAIDIMGDLDWFGAINSRPGASIETRCRLAWHHTNTELPFHLPVTQVARQLIAERGISLGA
jgi:hypothetical protein